LSASMISHGDGREVRGGNSVERPGHQLGLKQRQSSLEAIGARPRHLGDTRQVGPVVLLNQRDMIERLEGKAWPFADGPDYRVEAFVRPNGRSFKWDPRQPEHQRLELRFLVGEPSFEFRSASARFLRLPTQLRLLFGRSLRKLSADGVSLGT
jgi:hypothetical protein